MKVSLKECDGQGRTIICRSVSIVGDSALDSHDLRKLAVSNIHLLKIMTLELNVIQTL